MQRIQNSPDASPRANQTVQARRISDGQSLDTYTTDEDGFVTIVKNGHYPAFYLAIDGLPGGAKLWRSDDMAGVASGYPQEWPIAFATLGNGVIAGYGDELEVNATGVSTVSLGTGASLVCGIPVVQYSQTQLTFARPAQDSLFHVVGVRVNRTGELVGLAEFVVIEGDNENYPAMTETDDLCEVSLARVEVPSVGDLIVTDTRQFLQADRHDPVTDAVILDTSPFATDDTGGEAIPSASLTLSLPDESVYDISARVSAVQGPVAGSTSWTNLNTYGPIFNGISTVTLGQVAVDASGNVYIADTGNNRMVKLNSSGVYQASITGLTGVSGVAVDSSGNIYVAFRNAASDYRIRKYPPALSPATWTTNTVSSGSLRDLAVTGTRVWVAAPASDMVASYLLTNGTLADVIIGPTEPWGVCIGTLDGLLYFVDFTAGTVSVYNASLTLQRSFSVGTSSRGIASDASGNLWVAGFGDSRLRRYSSTGTLQATITQASPTGIGIASGDVLWVSSYQAGVADSGRINTWDEVTIGNGHGAIAVEIDGSVGTYQGIGNRDDGVVNVAFGSRQGGLGQTVTVRAFAKATSGTATFNSINLSAVARPRR